MSLTSVGIYEFNAKDLIGHGAFAVVYKGRLKTVSVIISSFHHSCRNWIYGHSVNTSYKQECHNIIEYFLLIELCWKVQTLISNTIRLLVPTHRAWRPG